MIKFYNFFQRAPKKKSRAFSLIELSVVIIIIGIFIAGSFAALSLIKKSRIQTAQALSKSAPIHGIAETALWLESSLDTSFADNQQKDGDAITAWNDQKSSSNKVTVSVVGSGPTYSNTINYIHAVKFSKVPTDNHLRIADASFLNNTDYTIVVLEKRQSSAPDNYFIGSPSTNPNDNLLLGYSNDATVIHKQGSNAYTTQDSTVSAYADSSDKPRLFTFISDSVQGKKTYINGVLAAQDPTNTAKLSGITSLEIGKGYTGEIGEIAIFTKPLRNEDRKAVEDYIGKKWSRKINRDSTPSCTNGAVTDGGCDLSLARCTLVATGLTSRSVAPAASPTTVNCDATHYNTSAQLNYTCINGTPNITSGTCTCATGYTGTGCNTCDSANNYIPDGMGGCVSAIPCALSTADVGISTPASVSHAAAGNAYCNANGYDSSLFRGYTCDNGNPNLTGSACVCNAAAGYAGGAGCPSCISGYYRSGATCLQKCTINSIPGITVGTQVNQGSSQTLACNDSANNFNTSDSITYTCAAGNSFSVVSGACDTCASGYTYVSGACVPPLTCAGGTKTCSNAPTGTLVNNCAGGNVVHTFTSSDTLTCTAGSTSSLSALFVGGGGSGGKRATDGGGGGGGGQVVTLSGKFISSGDVISVTVGAGGAAQTTRVTNGNRGVDTVVAFTTTSSATAANGNRLVASTTAAGGGGGGGYPISLSVGSPHNPTGPSGGSMGGKYYNPAPTAYAYVAGTGTQSGGNSGSTSGGGGGGGGSTANTGFAASGNNGGRGANGTTSSISGVSLDYGGGGGGGAASYTSPTGSHSGGVGGGNPDINTPTGSGGNGGTSRYSSYTSPGAGKRGGGGGGSTLCGTCDTSYPSDSGAGGPGIVIFAYPGS
ncbi:MAG: prepilin-type N-terminal cleavage/methylation domain-containing protein [Rickettsiales bacterium]|nr:prepilin-type N-terminal cleavage/methylation domain-containing protein [Rickettsiales bacterium]